MPRVNWSTVDHNDFERIAAVLIHRCHPRAQRLQASRGDKGIDILDPIAPETEEVYQVKSFTGSLTSRRRAQITNSFNRVLEARGARLRHWYLVVPMDRTTEGDDFFRELTKEAAFPCTWLGETFLDALAADYPEVIDYYLGNGKALLEAHLRDLSAVLGLQQKLNAPEEPIRPSEIRDLFSAVTAGVDTADPHFRYEFQSSAHQPSREELLSKVGAVACVTSWDGERSTTISIYLKYEAALEDRPIPMQLNIVALPGDRVASDLEAFLDYGLPVDLPSGAITDLRIDLPGGLGVDGITAAGRLGPVGEGRAQTSFLKLRLNDSNDVVLSELIFQLNAGSMGQRGGVATTGKDLSGVVGIRLMSMPPGSSPGSTNVNLNVLELFDKPVVTVREALRFLSNLQIGNYLSFVSFPGDQPFGLKLPVPVGLATDADFDAILAMVDDLALLQTRVPWNILLPESLPREIAQAVSMSARLLRGERVIRGWAEFSARITPEGMEMIQTEFSSPCAMLIESEMTLNLPGGEVPLGSCTHHIYSAVIDQPPKWDDAANEFVCTMRPGTSSQMEVVLGSAGSRSEH
ncbi:hypothetical protein BH10ACT3_BH10ACT3_00290 [soil metagenome]